MARNEALTPMTPDAWTALLQELHGAHEGLDTLDQGQRVKALYRVDVILDTIRSNFRVRHDLAATAERAGERGAQAGAVNVYMRTPDADGRSRGTLAVASPACSNKPEFLAPVSPHKTEDKTEERAS